ncbi:MAG: D-2-hydroxyacid dehydrogenase [Saprospiraceae bacterium]|jgi:D-3-phosphoglycerate dehydrogenase|nr:D-2-hydroxyacid dehydrogenase [Saprospiraceae bacterium]MBL0023595.1 D-2-hydroxyacid dehydrogenase [Saprospiraceae bacterium]
MKILVNDGIEPIGKKLLQEAGFEVDTNKIEQADLPSRLNEYDAICVRSATKVRKELIDACPNLKAIGRGGVGLDNIDVEYAISKGISVINTPAASSRSVGELTMAHMLSLSRFLYQSNRHMPVVGDTRFNDLKKEYAKGAELEGKYLGVIGLGRIGQETAKVGLGLGMNIIATDPFVKEVSVAVGPARFGFTTIIKTTDMDTLLAKADYISLHIPSVSKAILGKEEFEKMKAGVYIINASRGGTIDEDALLEALNSGKVTAAGLDVFDNEPTPRKDLLTHPKVSLTPHIGASTEEAQNKIGEELAQSIIAALKKQEIHL